VAVRRLSLEVAVEEKHWQNEELGSTRRCEMHTKIENELKTLRYDWNNYNRRLMFSIYVFMVF